MLSQGIFKSILSQDHVIYPLKIQVLYKYPPMGRLTKLKLSDGKSIVSGHLSSNLDHSELKPNTIISVSSLRLEVTRKQKIFSIKSFKIESQVDEIIGNPEILTFNKNSLKIEGFFTVQCKDCPIVFTHSAYHLDNFVFSYIQGVDVNSETCEIFCKCRKILGFRENEVFLVKEEAILVTRFPELAGFGIFQDRRNVESCLEAVSELRRRVKKIESSVEDRVKALEDRNF